MLTGLLSASHKLLRIEPSLVMNLIRLDQKHRFYCVFGSLPRMKLANVFYHAVSSVLIFRFSCFQTRRPGLNVIGHIRSVLVCYVP